MHLTTAEIVSTVIAVIGSIGVVAASIVGKHKSPKVSEIEAEAPLSAQLMESLQQLKEATQDNIELFKKVSELSKQLKETTQDNTELFKKVSELSKQLDEVQNSLEQEQQERKHEHQLRLDDDRKIKNLNAKLDKLQAKLDSN